MKRVMQVLFVDDNDDDNEFHSLSIRKTGVDVKLHSVNHPVKALECWKNGCAFENKNQPPLPELVFLDINMPALSGFELLDKIKKVPDPYDRLKEMKIFILSTSDRPDDYIKTIEKYGDIVMGYITKPLTGKAFLDILNQYY